VFILEELKVLCFDTDLQVFILKVDSGMAGAVAGFFVLWIPWLRVFLGNVGRKGVRWLAGYFMGYYTIWLAPVKSSFVPFWEWEREERRRASHPCKSRKGGQKRLMSSATVSRAGA
jgi:hypothetical protein